MILIHNLTDFTEIGCASNTDCPSQRACVNTICVDPCKQTDLCHQQEECQVQEHHPVCVKGKIIFKLKTFLYVPKIVLNYSRLNCSMDFIKLRSYSSYIIYIELYASDSQI